VVSDPSKNTGDVFSRVLDIAGHLQKMAKPGTILVSEYTYTRIRNKTEFAPAGISEKDHINVYLYQPKR
jgi:class 3 adenylate cyclase